jgi:hypothetical protein
MQNFRGGQVNFVYTWSPDIPGEARNLGFTVMAMLWGWNQVDHFRDIVKAGYANIALGFNEPNHPGQASMSPQDGAGLWKQYIQPLRSQGYTLGSPATTSAPDGIDWMQQFQAAGCDWDFTAVHWYGTNPDDFKAYTVNWHNTFGRDVMVTEYACQSFIGGPQCSWDDTFNFHKTMKWFFDGTPWIKGYLPFGGSSGIAHIAAYIFFL